jgi:glycosyltransferase involved in cell wall biosynthesis
MIMAVKRPGRVLLRRGRAGIRLAGLALDQRRALGLPGVAKRAAARLWVASRAPVPHRPETRPQPGAVFDAIYAIGYWEGEPKRYRVFNMAEGLRAAGYAVHVMPFDRLDEIRCHRWRATALVLFRAEYDRLAGIAEVLAYARAAGMRVFYDVDDLVFDPTLADRIDGLKLMGAHQRRQFVAAISRRRRLLLACDLASVSTAPLARAVAALGPPSIVIPNSLNREQLLLAGEIAHAARVADDKVRIGYFSGTRTHQRDFAECERALLEIMERFHRVRFRLVGYLDLGPQWQRYGDRVERMGFLPPGDLLRAIAETDINLAPLQRGNPFCEAKSELKFFEAALVRVPTIASATEPFATAIEDGVNGCAVRDYDEWRFALERLVLATALRKKMGEAAKARALARYSPDAVIPLAAAALGIGAVPATAKSA